jgi:hypothetical protein
MASFPGVLKTFYIIPLFVIPENITGRILLSGENQKIFPDLPEFLYYDCNRNTGSRKIDTKRTGG